MHDSSSRRGYSSDRLLPELRHTRPTSELRTMAEVAAVAQAASSSQSIACDAQCHEHTYCQNG